MSTFLLQLLLSENPRDGDAGTLLHMAAEFKYADLIRGMYDYFGT